MFPAQASVVIILFSVRVESHYLFCELNTCKESKSVRLCLHKTRPEPLYTCQLFLSQKHEIFILPIVRVSEDDLTISEGFWKLPRVFQRIPKS